MRVDIGCEIAAALPAVDIGESFSEGEASGVLESSRGGCEDDEHVGCKLQQEEKEEQKREYGIIRASPNGFKEFDGYRGVLRL